MLTAADAVLRSRKRRVSCAVIVFAVMVSAQVALPLIPNATATLVTMTVVTLAVAMVLIATLIWKPEPLLKASVAILALALVVEAIGASKGFPFGDYSYGEGLVPQLLDVPLVVPLAWLAMAVPAMELGRRVTGNPVLQSAAGGLALMGWDLFLDPLMVHYGYWTWASGGPSWQGIPLTNYFGWFVVGTSLCALASRALPPAEGPRMLLAGLYIWMVGFSTLGFVLPFAFDRPLTGLVGAAVAFPVIALAFAPRSRPWLAPL